VFLAKSWGVTTVPNLHFQVPLISDIPTQNHTRICNQISAMKKNMVVRLQNFKMIKAVDRKAKWLQD
jgi:hypothetical protein